VDAMTKKTSAALCALIAASAIAPAARAQEALPDIDIGAAPLRAPTPRRAEPAPSSPAAPSPVAASTAPALSKTPAMVSITTAKEVAETREFDIARALERVAPGVMINDVAGNPFAPEVDYRGFVASPISGTPQGLAVYQNGVRINEAWGDAVNWDLIPTIAIDRAAIVTGNPLFGLNAIGGAVVLDMKNGFNYQGFEVDGRGGSFGRRQGSMQLGVKSGDFASYLAMEAAGDNGYRKFSGSQIERLYGDIGYRAESGEIHFTTNLAQNRFGASGPAPADLVNLYPDSVYTTPQNYRNTLSQFGVNAAFSPAPNWNILADLHYRAFSQTRVDGNTTDFSSCGGDTLCNNNGDATGIPDLLGPNVPLGVTDRTWTSSRTWGGTVQVENSDKIFERPNKFTFGVSLDSGWTSFNANEQVGMLNPYDLSVAGLGLVVNEPASNVSPVKLNAANTYFGVYALDAIDVTDQLTITAGARYNYAGISLFDLKGTTLNGNAIYTRVNPMAGATYKITPELAVYASYSEANRAPTPLELGCADPNRPCLIDNFLVSDPPLKQVTSQTIESGFRGSSAMAQYLPQGMKEYLPGRLEWSAGVFRTLAFNDILSVQSAVTGLGYFTNAGTTQRQGIETQWRYHDDKLSAYINYTLTDATFRSLIDLGSPFNPLAVAVGSSSILVTPGAHLTGAPKHRLKAGFDYALTNEWKIGADLVFAAGTWVRGDEINAFGTMPSYATLNLRSSYQVTKNVQLYGLIDNVTNTRARSFGTFFNTTQIPFLSFSDPRMVSVSPPIGFFAGAKVTF
jgi:iron complex outermembrane recepter protein